MKKPNSRNCCFFQFILSAICILSLSIATVVGATESGGSAYPGGNEDFMLGALPPAGSYFLSYNMNYSSNSLMDDNGNELPLGTDVDVWATVFRYVHVTEKKLLGADVVWHAVVPFVHQSVEFDALGVDKSSSGIGDIEVGPFGLSWHFNKNFHMVSIVDVWFPTGDYDKNDASSIGRNYWTVAPIVAATYLSDIGFEVSGKFQYLFNRKNSDTEYRSGQEFICDYLVGQHIGNWKFGVNGYYYQQITDDKQNGLTVNNNKGRCLSVGPVIQYNYKNMFFNVKVQFDTLVENRLEGRKIWFKFFYAF